MGRKKSGLERIVGGVTSGIVVGGLWWFHVLGTPWAIGLGVLLCVLPILGGVRRTAREIADRSHDRRKRLADQRTIEVERKDSLEKKVLQVARDRRGVVTPALVVLDTDLRLEEAEKVLEALAARGHAEMRIKVNGTIDYVFQDLSGV